MSEKLLPFDMEEYKKDPSRLRSSSNTVKVRHSTFLGNYVIVQWDVRGESMPSIYSEHSFQFLRLAVRTRKIRARFFSRSTGNIFCAVSYTGGLTELAEGNKWVSDIFEHEIDV